jgi:hypothetical protein
MECKRCGKRELIIADGDDLVNALCCGCKIRG